MVGHLCNFRGCDVDGQDEDTWTPAHYAAFYGHAPVLVQLFERSANPNSCNLNFCTPLHFAAGRGNIECCRVLLEFGADPSLLDEDKMSPAARARELKPDDWSAVAFVLDLCRFLQPVCACRRAGKRIFVVRAPLRLEAESISA